mgnify:CR=1 FL=1
MRLDLFEMERLQSTWENRVKFNLSESSVHPMSVRELIPDAGFHEQLLGTPLVYNQSNGTDELREAIAALYPGATLDHVEVTNGGSEAIRRLAAGEPDECDRLGVLVVRSRVHVVSGFAHSMRPAALIRGASWNPRCPVVSRACPVQPATSMSDRRPCDGSSFSPCRPWRTNTRFSSASGTTRNSPVERSTAPSTSPPCSR